MSESESADKELSLTEYLQHVIRANRRVRLHGISSSKGLIHIDLEEIYVPAMAMIDRTRWIEQTSSSEKNYPDTNKREAVAIDSSYEGPLIQFNKDLEFCTLIAHNLNLIMLGKPGSGKTTLLQYLALTFARDIIENPSLVESRLHISEVRMPILLSLREFSLYLQQNYPDAGLDGPKHLINYLDAYFDNQELKLSPQFFASRLDRGECLLLLDGLDEIVDLEARRRVMRIIERTAVACNTNRFIVTCRIASYLNIIGLGESFKVAIIREFTNDNINSFLQSWNLTVEVALAGGPEKNSEQKAVAQTEDLMRIIEGKERLRELAVNPLMLTLLAIVHRVRGQLSEHRAELYEEATDVLLSNWDVAKDFELPFNMAEVELDAGDCRSLLGPIALWMMEQQTNEIDTEELKEQLGKRFREVFLDDSDDRVADKVAESFLRVVSERSGLLDARDLGTCVFSHIAFQEYLAARAICDRPDYIEYTLERLTDPWWREVIVLEAGYLGMQGQQRVTKLVEKMIDYHSTGPELFYHLELAAECLYEAGRVRVTSKLRSELQKRLLSEFEKPIKESGKLAESLMNINIRRRASAAEALARVESGLQTGQPVYWRYPYGEPVWRAVSAGEFWIGSDSSEETMPIHRLFLEQFMIARVPVTNQQYFLFVEKSGAQNIPSHWVNGKVPQGLESHPIVNVTWYDAMAYCTWLSQVTNKQILLPSEAQWEKAARGTTDNRAYPWGDVWNGNNTNSNELSVENTTPVGIFPSGASACGCLDMAGNVWEWTSSRWGDNSERPTFKYPFDPNDGRQGVNTDNLRVLRGGSFADPPYRLCLSYRDRKLPTFHWKHIGFRVIVE